MALHKHKQIFKMAKGLCNYCIYGDDDYYICHKCGTTFEEFEPKRCENCNKGKTKDCITLYTQYNDYCSIGGEPKEKDNE